MAEAMVSPALLRVRDTCLCSWGLTAPCDALRRPAGRWRRLWCALLLCCRCWRTEQLQTDIAVRCLQEASRVVEAAMVRPAALLQMLEDWTAD